MKKLLLAALAVLCSVQAFAAADQVRDGDSFNTPNCQRKYVRRTVDSTGTVAGRMDSAVVICAPNVMPTPLAVGGVYDTDTTSRVLRMTSTGALKTDDAARDRDLDFGVTNLVSSVAIDSGGTGGANFRYSTPLDVRKWSSGNIVIHITAASAADTVGHYVYGVTVFPLTSATLDWTTVGVPIATFVPTTIGASAAATDTLGFNRGLNGITANAIQTFPGERAVVLSTDRTTSNYANVNAAQTVSYPWSYWLGPMRPRYIAVQVRLMSRDAAAVPSVRIDAEGLR